MQNIISMRDFTRPTIDKIIHRSLEIKNGSPVHQSPGMAASLFFEPSTRTRTSSELALQNVGKRVIGFAGTEGTSVKKGEPLSDTLRMYHGYDCNMVVMRHNLEGAARFASTILDVPIINGGDGSNGHPTQTFLDLTTIHEKYKHLDGLTITLVGDLKYGRTVHSLLQALTHYDINVHIVCPENLSIPQWRIDEYSKLSGREISSLSLSKATKISDVLYVTRIQRERFPEGKEGDMEYKKVSGQFDISLKTLNGSKKNLSVMHPLPRYKHHLELGIDIDETPYSLYFEQAKNGQWTRTALFEQIENGGFPNPPIPSSSLNTAQYLSLTDTIEHKRPRFYIFENGTFIDHLEPGTGYKLRPLLGLMDYRDSTLLAVNNLPSKKFELKDVYAIADRFFKPEELWKIALVSDRATINIIRNSAITEKFNVSLPYLLEALVSCVNQNCISHPDNHEHVPARFYVESQRPDPLALRCMYCEKPASKGEFNILTQ